MTDDELSTLAQIIWLLAEFEPEAQARMLRYLADRFDVII